MTVGTISNQESACQATFDERPIAAPPARLSSFKKKDGFEYLNCKEKELRVSTEKKFETKNPLGEIINVIRNIWKNIRVFNPFTHLFNYLEKIRCAKYIESAKNRNNAKTKEDLTRYHTSLLFKDSNPDDKALFKMHITEGQDPKPLVVLFLGNAQTHNWSDENAGLIKLFNKIKNNNDADILIFRVGNASDELKYKFGISENCSLNTNVIYEHTKNIIEDCINGKGIFEEHLHLHLKPSKIILCGYSWGGGTIDKLLKDNWNKTNNVPIGATAYIDAIKLGSFNLGCPIDRRPLYSQNHINFYQNNSMFLNGSELNGNNNHDISENVQDTQTDHLNIDDKTSILDKIYRFIKKHTKK